VRSVPHAARPLTQTRWVPGAVPDDAAWLDHVGQCIDRTAYSTATHLEHMRIDHRGGHIRMAEQVLHGADVVPRLQQVRGKAVAPIPMTE